MKEEADMFLSRGRKVIEDQRGIEIRETMNGCNFESFVLAPAVRKAFPWRSFFGQNHGSGSVASPNGQLVEQKCSQGGASDGRRLSRHPTDGDGTGDKVDDGGEVRQSLVASLPRGGAISLTMIRDNLLLP